LAYCRKRGDGEGVEREFRTIISQMPLDIQPQLGLARFYMERGSYTAMAGVLEGTLAVQPTKLAERSLGDLALQGGRPDTAILYYRALDLFPQEKGERLENGYLLGVAYAEAGALDSARAVAARVLALDAAYAPARELARRLGLPGH
ncbi:MAG TPA: hypothetical protein VL221_14340, partial [Bacteroidota bacterium]|nr:hypothetical protein [Bacteroidota bacterium]